MRALATIAVGYDTSAAGRDALLLGELLARTTGGELLVVRVHPESGEGDSRRADQLRAELEVALGASTLRPQARVLADRSPSRALLELAKSEPDIGLIAVAAAAEATLRVLAVGPGARACANRARARRPQASRGRPTFKAVCTRQSRRCQPSCGPCRSTSRAWPLACCWRERTRESTSW